MIGETTEGKLIAGHTGGGPGSAVAVYHRLDRPDRHGGGVRAGGDRRDSRSGLRGPAEDSNP